MQQLSKIIVFIMSIPQMQLVEFRFTEKFLIVCIHFIHNFSVVFQLILWYLLHS